MLTPRVRDKELHKREDMVINIHQMVSTNRGIEWWLFTPSTTKEAKN
jgi:hypothetical protein